MALYLAAVAVTNAGMSGRTRSGWWWALAAAAVAVADVLVRFPAVAVAAVLAVLLAAVVLVGLEQEAQGRINLETV